MAAMGVAAGIEYAKTGKKVSGYVDTGVTLIADKPWRAWRARTPRPAPTVLGQEVSGTRCEPAGQHTTLNGILNALPPSGALGPFMALLGACIFFATQSDRFLTRRELLADPAAGDGGRRDRHRPDADHPHRPASTCRAAW
jgi:hypothetical protein